jgi:hypothetical protein
VHLRSVVPLTCVCSMIVFCDAQWKMPKGSCMKWQFLIISEIQFGTKCFCSVHATLLPNKFLFQKLAPFRILDNLPVVVPRQTREGSQIPSFEHGYRVGYKVCISKNLFIV